MVILRLVFDLVQILAQQHNSTQPVVLPKLQSEDPALVKWRSSIKNFYTKGFIILQHHEGKHSNKRREEYSKKESTGTRINVWEKVELCFAMFQLNQKLTDALASNDRI